MNSALLVDRLAGLRNQDQLQAEGDLPGPQPGYVGSRYRDASGRLWQELHLAVLARDERFSRIVAAE
jgi:twitching motility protein PilI